MNYELYEQVITTLKNNGKTLFTAESCTAGLVAANLANVSGASDVLLGGLVAYHNDIKTNCLNVSSQTIEEFGAVSFECVEEMVVGALELSKADYSIAITGIAGPTGGSEEKPVGTVYTAVYSAQGGWSQRFFLEGDRMDIRHQSVELCLKMLLATELEDDFLDARLRDAREID